jgi:hypothetical protein
MTPQTVLKKAKEKLSDPDKWVKDSEYVTNDGCMCAMGAVYQSLDPDARDQRDLSSEKERIAQIVEGKLDYAAAEHTDYLMSCVIFFNDFGGTTHEDLMKVFDIAIEKEDQE